MAFVFSYSIASPLWTCIIAAYRRGKMKSTVMAGLLAGLLSAPTHALAVPPQSRDTPSRVVGMDVQRRKITNPLQRDKLRRRGTAQATLDNEVCSQPTRLSVRVYLHCVLLAGSLLAWGRTRVDLRADLGAD